MAARSKAAHLPFVGDQHRLVCFIPVGNFVEGHGYRVAFVKEGEGGYYPTGNWPCNYSEGHKMPWFWGPSYEQAQKLAQEQNERMGVDELTAAAIIADSMARPFHARRGS